MEINLSRPQAQEYVRIISGALAAIARGIELLVFDSDKNMVFPDISESPFSKDYLEIQRINFRFKEMSGRLPSYDKFYYAVSETLLPIERFLHESAVMGGRFRFRVRIPRRTNLRHPYIHPLLAEGGTLTSNQAVKSVVDSLRSVIDSNPFFEIVEEEIFESNIEEIDIAAVRKNIPDQKVAPFHFDIVDNKLVVVDQAAVPKLGSDTAIAQSLDTLIDQGQEIVDSLSYGNCDKRLCDKIKSVNELLRNTKNIIRLGLESMTSKAMATALSQELPDVLAAQIGAFCSGIEMYVSQFEEWQVFVQNSAEAVIEGGHESTLALIVKSVADELSNASDYVDPEVPRTIQFLADLVNNPQKASKRAAFALIRTVENLVSKTFGYAIDIFDQTARKTVDKASDMASTLIAKALLPIGLVAAANMLPLASSINGMEWIDAAYKLVSREILPRLP